VTQPTASFTVKHVNGSPPLTVDPAAKVWQEAAVQVMDKDCQREIDYPELKTEVRAFWTDTDLYFLFRCPYTVLNVWPADNSKPHPKLWDRDVVEMFIGSDWQNIRRYREFEMAPTGDWIDLAIDLNRHSFDSNWRSGWQVLARIDQDKKAWYAACKIPLSAISGQKVKPGTVWRGNLYRIDGVDPQRRFLCWQPTCVRKPGSNHTPEHFGTFTFR
jgi:hypothetical protein